GRSPALAGRTERRSPGSLRRASFGNTDPGDKADRRLGHGSSGSRLPPFRPATISPSAPRRWPALPRPVARKCHSGRGHSARPDVTVLARVDQLGGDAHAPTHLAHAAL